MSERCVLPPNPSTNRAISESRPKPISAARILLNGVHSFSCRGANVGWCAMAVRGRRVHAPGHCGLSFQQMEDPAQHGADRQHGRRNRVEREFRKRRIGLCARPPEIPVSRKVRRTDTAHWSRPLPFLRRRGPRTCPDGSISGCAPPSASGPALRNAARPRDRPSRRPVRSRFRGIAAFRSASAPVHCAVAEPADPARSAQWVHLLIFGVSVVPFRGRNAPGARPYAVAAPDALVGIVGDGSVRSGV